jgi:hypothetical protein
LVKRLSTNNCQSLVAFIAAVQDSVEKINKTHFMTYPWIPKVDIETAPAPDAAAGRPNSSIAPGPF